MKTLNKAVIAAAVAAALTPVASQADTTIFGQIDMAVAVESAEETAIVVEGSPVGDNILGIEGEVETSNGNAITYQYVINLDVDNDADTAFGSNYHSYIGYKWDSVEVRAGNLDLPLRLALDKADMFAGTYADQNNIIGGLTGATIDLMTPTITGTGTGAGNTTAGNALMVLGGNDSFKYAVSIDAADENANNADQSDSIRFGGMVDFNASETLSLALGFESLTDSYSSVGASANIAATDALDISVALNSFSEDTPDAVNTDDFDAVEAVIGIKFATSETVDLKAQFGQIDIDGADDFTPTYFALGADFEIAESATFYVLATSGSDLGLLTAGATDVTIDGDFEQSVVAAGLRVNF